MSALDVRWAGDRSLILDFETLNDAMSACAALDSSPVEGQVDVIAGARTALVRLRSHWHAMQAMPALAGADFPTAAAPKARTIVVDVVYDGTDLTELAQTLGMSVEALIEWHTGQAWLGAFSGVAGFVYCVPQGETLAIPRRPSPRTAVPGGSVMVAAGFSGIYPRTGPSGWQVIGRTDTQVWDLVREEPALIRPWDTITYRPVHAEARALEAEADPADTAGTVHATSTAASAGETSAHSEETTGSPAFEVLDPGLRTLVQDRGREGVAALGAGVSGVIDRRAAYEANTLVGNSADSAVLETLFGGLRLRALVTTVVAVSGAAVDITIDRKSEATRAEMSGRSIVVLAGEILALGHTLTEARVVVALRGGIDVPHVLGSASTDTHIGLGPRPLGAGDVVRVGSSPRSAVSPSSSLPVRRSHPTRAVATDEVVLGCVFGPRDDWFSEAERNRFANQRWRVTPASDRIGIRLIPGGDGERHRPLTRANQDELLSEGMALGSVQVPPSGNPVLLINDQAITGGYPIIAVVIESELSKAAQLMPGDTIRFAPVDPITKLPLTLTGGTEK